MPAPSPAVISLDAQGPASSFRRLRLLPAALAAGIGVYAAALIATLPARLVAGDAGDVVGTVWHGAAALPGGATVRWDWSLPPSLAAGTLAADTVVAAPDTALTGVAEWRHGVGLTRLRGRAGWPLLAALVPGVPACAIALDVALDQLAATDVAGTVTSRAGTCPDTSGAARPVPRLIATFTGASGRIAPWSDRTTTLATIDLGATAIGVHVTTAGAAVLPFGRTGDIEFAR